MSLFGQVWPTVVSNMSRARAVTHSPPRPKRHEQSSTSTTYAGRILGYLRHRMSSWNIYWPYVILGYWRLMWGHQWYTAVLALAVPEHSV